MLFVLGKNGNTKKGLRKYWMKLLFFFIQFKETFKGRKTILSQDFLIFFAIIKVIKIII